MAAPVTGPEPERVHGAQHDTVVMRLHRRRLQKARTRTALTGHRLLRGVALSLCIVCRQLWRRRSTPAVTPTDVYTSKITLTRGNIGPPAPTITNAQDVSALFRAKRAPHFQPGSMGSDLRKQSSLANTTGFWNGTPISLRHRRPAVLLPSKIRQVKPDFLWTVSHCTSRTGGAPDQLNVLTAFARRLADGIQRRRGGNEHHQ